MGFLPREPARLDVAIAVGGNTGSRGELLARFVAARRRIAELCGAPAVMSKVRITEPVGSVRDQSRFLNAVIRTDAPRAMRAEDLLRELLAFEDRCGRVRAIPGGPRPIDLDLLWFGEREASSARLTLPHPRLRERDFVVDPLCELYGESYRLPVTGERLGALLSELS